MEDHEPFRNWLKPEKRQDFASDSWEGLGKEVDKWLADKGESIVVARYCYSMEFVPNWSGYFQPHFKRNMSATIWYYEQKWFGDSSQDPE